MWEGNMTKVSVKMIVCILEISVIELVSTQWSKGKRKSEAIDITYLTNYVEITFFNYIYIEPPTASVITSKLTLQTVISFTSINF